MTTSFTQRFLQALAFAFALSLGGAALAADPLVWQINLPASSLTFNTTKAGAAGVGGVTETMRFKAFKGGVDAQGRIQLDIDLTSIDSGIDIRNERLQTMFWNVAAHPSVNFSAQIKPEDVQKINASKESLALWVEGQLTMAGQTKPVKVYLQITPMNGKLMVSTRQAIIINANDFGLNAGVEALRAIMGLNFLSSSAPVVFALELTKPAM